MGFWAKPSLNVMKREEGNRIECAVLVYGGTVAGIAAALAAARAGCSTVLIERGDHWGGMTAAGLGSIDTLRQNAFGGIFRELRTRVRAHYAAAYGFGSEQVRLTYDGLLMEPHVAERVLDAMLAEQTGLRLFKRLELRRVERRGADVVASTYQDRDTGDELRVAHQVAIDGTYEGDLAAAAGVPCRVGREGRGEYGERFAGVIYYDWRAHRQQILPESTGEPSDLPQAYCFRVTLSDDPARRIPFPRPQSYADFRTAYCRGLLSDLETGRVRFLREILWLIPHANRKHNLNGHIEALTSTNLAEVNRDWSAATWDVRDALFRQYREYTEGLLWFLQNDPAVPRLLREEAGGFGLPPDEYPAEGHFPWQLYVREARRMRGVYVLTEHDSLPPAGRERPRIHPDTVATYEHSFDTHPCRTRGGAGATVRAADGFELLEGVIWFRNKLKSPNRPATIPLGAILPEAVDGLLVPGAVSASHVAFSAIRKEPVWMALGQAAGTAAAQAITARQPVRRVEVSRLQRQLAADGQVLVHFDDLALDDPEFAAVQLRAVAEDPPTYSCADLRTPAAGR
jgi:hypothetical protein